jgi:ComF family protein
MCGECVLAPPPFASALTAVDYAYPWDRLINDFKFNDALDLADVLARLLIDAHARRSQPAPDLMLAVPLSNGRLRERGYNQSWELARRVARQLNCRADDTLLLRITDTPHQLALPREVRARNVLGAFAVEPTRRIDLRGRSVTLVDDVMTTRATAGEVTRTLLAAGAAAVHLWVVARTPAPAP